MKTFLKRLTKLCAEYQYILKEEEGGIRLHTVTKDMEAVFSYGDARPILFFQEKKPEGG